ncbi:hypothetical protein GCM10009574_099970 [Streptomyces asiaticus]|uniref:Uncharacterized protein n=2 Tax=Streptomyces rhizosphaericus TaxID=114699 RepID=A0ABN1SRH9_9ACTN
MQAPTREDEFSASTAVGAGSGEIVSAAGQCGRDPQQLARGISDDLQVHTVAAVFLGEVGPAVADPVALGERAVEQDVLRGGLRQDTQQAGCPGARRR